MRRIVYLVHRWTAIAMCILLALWFGSGMVMLFVGYPKLMTSERLGALPALPVQGCCVDMADVTDLTLTSIRGRPHFVLRAADGRLTAVDAASGKAAEAVGPAEAVAGAGAFGGGVPAVYSGLVTEDRWTHSRALNPHRPLHVVELGDAAATRVYVSSTTGQVVLDAPRGERAWNYVGAWLHWLYMLRSQPVDPVWTWTIIVISSIGVLSAVTGIVNGVWRWRFAGRYKNGSRTPYREAFMRWHHLLGLTFGAILCTWIFSGLMSMNPVGMFDAGNAPDMAAYRGADGAPPAVGAGTAVRLLRGAGFVPVELEWRVLDGQPFILARDRLARTRLVMGNAVLERWPAARLRHAAARLLPARIVAEDALTEYDRFYFARGSASMYGGDARGLPAVRFAFDDAGATLVYVDPRTGEVALSLDRAQRAGRWLFNLLHSWDLPVLLDGGWSRDAVLILLSLGGLGLSVTGIVIGVRRIRASAGAAALINSVPSQRKI